MTDPLVLALATFLFTVFGTAVTTTWRVSRMLENRDRVFIKMMSDHELADVNRFAAVGTEIIETSDTLRREFGETGIALRQKMHEMEMWGRDNNLQKSSFYKAISTVDTSIKDLSEKIDRQIERDARVDRK